MKNKKVKIYLTFASIAIACNNPISHSHAESFVEKGLSDSLLAIDLTNARDSTLLIQDKYTLPIRIVKFKNMTSDTLFFNKSPIGWFQFPSRKMLYKDSLTSTNIGSYADFVEDTIPPNSSKDMFIMKEEKSIGVKFGFYYSSSKNKRNFRTFEGEIHW